MLMMIKHKTPFAPSGLPARQSGVVLIISLIVLIAMTLSALSLIRSVNMTNLIAGNLAFRESAVLSAERTSEYALQWLLGHESSASAAEGTAPEGAVPSCSLHSDCAGYRSARADPAVGANWETFWNELPSGQVVTLSEDVAGNRGAYIIHRLCERTGAPHQAKCSKPPKTNSNDTQIGGEDPIAVNTQVYYRITSRVSGPRNTTVYTQTIVAL
jgi:Tfp pilus assembly protein PilX